jgi:hypothetical protein
LRKKEIGVGGEKKICNNNKRGRKRKEKMYNNFGK